jgi:hypothetical protein
MSVLITTRFSQQGLTPSLDPRSQSVAGMGDQRHAQMGDLRNSCQNVPFGVSPVVVASDCQP